MTAVPAHSRPQLAPSGRAWSLGWLLAQGVLLGLLLLLFGDRAGRAWLALVVAAAPAAAGMLQEPEGEHGGVQLLGWTIACALAAGLAGGLAGPLATYLLMPAVVALLQGLGAGWAAGATAVAAAGAALGGRVAGPAGLEAAALGWGAATSTAVFGGGAWTAAHRPAAALSPGPAPPPPSPGRPLQEAERQRDEAIAERDAARDTAAARTRFLAQMSHELRTPLNAIIGFSDIMRARLFGPLPERYGEYAGLIHESGEHLLSMINDVLDLAKTEAGRYELRRSVFDAREALNAALRIVRVQADEAGIDLRASPAPEPIVVDADERALKQMALNLLANALKFTARGGHVTAAVAPVDGQLQLQVADTGVGIPPADLERLGRPFEQGESARGRGGTGLGLSLVRSFAQLHGGEMRIESRVGAGTAVTVRMPVLATSAAD